MTTSPNQLIYQFKVTLQEIEPAIWRRLQVPVKYSFWDLHVAIQDAMGWLDDHLHEFRLRKPHGRKMIEIGIPDDEFGGAGAEVLPGWDIPIRDAFTKPGQTALYAYDFGDGWQHDLLLEGILLKETGVTYPLHRGRTRLSARGLWQCARLLPGSGYPQTPKGCRVPRNDSVAQGARQEL